MEQCIGNLVKKSRSIRRFREAMAVEGETLKELVDIARFCPSARNRQPLRYCLTTDPAQAAAVFSCLQWALDLPDWGGPKEGERPMAFITMVAKRGAAPDPSYDAGIAAQTILLAAAERGLGGCMLGSVRREELSGILSLPGHYEIILVLAIGHPGESVVLEPLGEDGDTRYWHDTDGVHHVPKRSLEEILITTGN